MKVRILSGNQTGAVVDMPVTEAQVNISTGFAEAVIEEEAPVVPEVEAEPKPEPEPQRFVRRPKPEPSEE